MAGARETNVVGRHFWPGQVFRSLGLFFLIGAVVAVLGGLAQINPVWVYGPYNPARSARRPSRTGISAGSRVCCGSGRTSSRRSSA